MVTNGELRTDSRNFRLDTHDELRAPEHIGIVAFVTAAISQVEDSFRSNCIAVSMGM
jgi:hypothetical protein